MVAKPRKTSPLIILGGTIALEINPDDGVGLYARRMSAPAQAVLVETSESDTKLLYVQS